MDQTEQSNEPVERPSLGQLASLGAQSLMAGLTRALPLGEPGQVSVAAFNSSI